MSEFSASPGYPAATTNLTLPIPSVDFTAAKFATTEEGVNKVVLTNLASPVDQPETARIERQHVANVYTGTNIPRTLWATSTRGFSLVGQVNDIWRITNTGDPTFMLDLPVSAHWVLKCPSTPYLTVAQLTATLTRSISLIGENGKNLNEYLRGAVRP